MEDKMFELMSKIYGELTEFRKETNKRLGNLENDVIVLKNDVVRLETKVDDGLKVLFDGYKQTYEKLGALEIKVDGISQKVEKQDVEIRVIKGGK